MIEQAFRGVLLFAAALCCVTAMAQSPPPVNPASEIAPDDSETIDWQKERQHWSFQRPKARSRPAVKDSAWPKQRLDFFILSKLEQEKLAPSAEAERRVLIRRLTYDLTGLPPTADEIAAFLADEHPDAYPRLVERLLASPRFGERMASLWLPLARYAEDQAHQVGSDTTMFYPNAYRYREWVIQAFNQDLPYDQFLRFQLAADKIAAGAEHLPALGFLGLGPKYYNRNRVEVQADEWEDRVDTVTRTMLGLTVACSRCHDHKFDPITTKDYYALAGVFASTKMVNKAPDGKIIEGKVSADKMPPGTLHLVEDGAPQNLNIFIRGNVERKAPVVERRFLRVLSDDEPEPFKDGSGRRELADAIASRDNPLTARVVVNRLWGAFFGRPLVATPSNFGRSGMRPSHPELLDDLAVRFMDTGWSIKALVREIVLSSSYRQRADHDAAKAAIDPENRWFWRMDRRRLSIEQWRDGVMFVSGELAWEGGKSQELNDPANHRRTVYSRISRLELNDLLMQFDYPDANVHAEKRSETTTATQKLFMLNSPFILKHASALAARRTEDSAADDTTRIQRAYEILFGRAADTTELRLGREFLSKPATSGMPTRWEQYAQLLLISNEMLYLD